MGHTELKSDKEKVKFLKGAIKSYESEIKSDSNNTEAYNNWGNALRYLAELKPDKIKEDLLKQAVEKYEKAVSLDESYYKAYDNWGDALLELVAIKKGKQKFKLLDQAFDVLMKAEDIKEGEGSYNIACIFSLNGEKEKTLEWLEKSLKNDTAPAYEHILEDPHLEYIRGSKKLKRLLDKYSD